MDRKTILVGVLAFGLIGLVALGLWLVKPASGLRGTTYAEPYRPRRRSSCTWRRQWLTIE